MKKLLIFLSLLSFPVLNGCTHPLPCQCDDGKTAGTCTHFDWLKMTYVCNC